MGVCREGLGRHMNSAGLPTPTPSGLPWYKQWGAHCVPCECSCMWSNSGLHDPVVLVTSPPPGIAWNQRKQVSVGLGFRKARRTWAPAEPQPRAGLRAKASVLERSNSREHC